MTYLVIFIIGAAVGFLAGLRRAEGRLRESLQRAKGRESFADLSEAERGEMEAEAREALEERTEERKSRILEFMRREGSFDQALKTCSIEEGENRAGITRAEIEKLLEVSDRTARKYLGELEAENKIEQVGAKGKDVFYTLKSGV